MSHAITMPRRSLVLIVLALCLVWYFVFAKGWPRFGHWLIHKRGWAYGRQILWRRPSDGVQMRAHICPICGLRTNIEPVRISYKRMMRGERFY